MRAAPRSIPARGRLAGALVACLLAGLLSATAEAQVTSGPLRASITPDPWRLQLADGARANVLTEHAGRGLGPTGSLGFRTPVGWFHATRVASGGMQGGSFVATLDTTDPLHDLQVTIEPGREGVIRLTASVLGDPTGITATGMGFDAPAGERYLGFGERNVAVDHRGQVVENFVSDGPYQPEERPAISVIVPEQGFRFRDDATYFPMPWLLSTAGYGVLIGNTETSYFRLGTEDPTAWSLEAEATQLTLSFVAGPNPADVVRRLTELVGRQPPLAAPWVLGPWHQPYGSGDRLAQARALRDGDVPGSAVNTYLHYLPCGDQQGVEAQQPQTTGAFHDAGYAITTYFNPMICTGYQPAYDDAVAAGVLTEDSMGNPYVYQYGSSPTSLFNVSQFDYSAPGATEFYGSLLAEAVGHGYDGWMEDFGEYTPPDSMSANGMTGEQMHNLYPTLYHCASHAYTSKQSRPVVAFIRSGWTGVHPCAQIVWGGDPTTGWDYDGINSAIKQALTLGVSGISRWGSDIGGFFALGFNRLTDEMLVRWIQLGAVSGVMRTEANGVAVPEKARPQINHPQILPHWRRYAKLRTQLYPYILAAEAEYRRSGMPLMRHLALTHPTDAAAIAQEDEFMFGPDLLAAPVHQPGATSRSVYVPPGRWVDFWRTVAYNAGPGSLRLGRADPFRGGGQRTIPAPLGELPMLIRAGAVLALLPSHVDTLAAYGSDSTVRLDEVPRSLHLLAFPRGKSSSTFGDAGTLRSKEKKDRWRLTIKGAPRHKIDLEAALGTLKRDLRPCRVERNGKPLKKKKWSAKKGVLRVKFKTKRKGKTNIKVFDKATCRAARKRG